MSGLTKNIFWAIMTLLIIAFIFSLFYTGGKAPTTLSLDQLAAKINAAEVSKIAVNGNDLSIQLKDGSQAISTKETEAGLSETLKNYGVDPAALQKVGLEIQSESGWRYWASILIPSLLPLLIIGFFFWLMFRQARTGMSQAFTFGRANIKLFGQFRDHITFRDVAGLKEAKEELLEVVDFLKNPKKYLEIGARIPRGVLLLGSPGTGKCVTGESLILTNKGIIEIQDIPKYFYVDPKTNRVHGAQLPTISLDPPKQKTNFASHWYDLGEQNTIKITLKQGFQLEGTPEHPVVVLNENGDLEFKKLSELKEDYSVAVKFNTQVFGSLKEVDSKKAYVMGLLTGDGNLSHGNRIGLTTIDKEIVGVFHNYINDNYGGNVKTHKASDGITQFVSSWDVKKDFYKAGMSYLLSYDKTIPYTILQAPKEIVVAFLQGLFDSDGYFERYNIGYATVSKKLSDQVMTLLLNLGVVPSRRIKSNVDQYHTRPVYEIMISGTALRKFAKEIGFRLPRKQKPLEEYLSTRPQSNTNVDVIPYVNRKIEKNWKILSDRKLSSSYLASLIDKIRDRGRVSRDSLKVFIDVFDKYGLKNKDIIYLKALYNADIFFLPVEKKEHNRAQVYDFTVPNTHSFISNGLISHNTLLARAVAGEANVPFFHISASEFVEMFVGVGAARTRDAFATAKRAAPSILFIDEIDAVGRERGAGLGGGHDEREQTLNQILVEMDGFDRETQVIVIAATNRPDILDPALLRPGRFDRRIVLDLPDINDREAILQIHSRGKILAKDVELRRAAERTPGFSGADLANLMNEAAILAARKNQKEIIQQDVFDSIEKVLLGPERRSRVLSVKEKEIIAYHEAGHALVAASLKNADPVHKVSIVSRGRAAGYTLKLPVEDTYLRTKSQFTTELAVLLGGYVSEQITFRDISTGGSNDLQAASDLSRKLVTKFGMSEKLGPITYGKTEELVFLGREIATEKNYSEKVAAEIDNEVKSFIDKAMLTAKKIVTLRKKVLQAIAKKLIEKETLERDEFESLIKSFRIKPISA